MAPVLFNLYASLLVERWTARTQRIDGIGVQLKYKHLVKSDPETATEKVTKHRLEWLGHLARMNSQDQSLRLATQALPSWRPSQTVERCDLPGGCMVHWSHNTRAGWHALHREALTRESTRDDQQNVQQPINQVYCQQCMRLFRRESRDTNTCLSGRNQSSNNVELCSVQCAQSGFSVGEDSQFTHVDQIHTKYQSRDIQCPLGVRVAITAAKRQDRTGVCVCERERNLVSLNAFLMNPSMLLELLQVPLSQKEGSS